MKRTVAIGCALATFVLTANADPVPTATVHKVIVWVQGSDADLSQKLEFQLLEGFADRQVPGERFSQLFPNGGRISNRRKIQMMRDGGFDSLLFLQRSSAIHWDNAQSTGTALSPLRAFLRKNAPADETLEVVADSGTTVTKTIEVDNAYGTWDVVKGRAVLFDLHQENMLWTERTQIKSPKGLSTDRYVKTIATLLLSDLADAHFISTIKK